MFKNSINEKHLKAFNWLMHLADGYNSNYDISKKSKIDIKIINEAIKMFYKKKLIKFNESSNFFWFSQKHLHYNSELVKHFKKH